MPELKIEEHIYNKTFKGIHRFSYLNACVGNNGQPDLPEYAGGFMDAALRLGELVIKRDSENSVDEFIYPIAFNMRHSVEIWLKYFLKQLKKIRSDKIMKLGKEGGTEEVINEKDMTNTHNINTFWEWFRFNSESRDVRFLDINQRLDEYISDIGEIDPTGQTFRYPYNTESQKHLVKTPIINLANLTNRIFELKQLIKELYHLILEIGEEYCTGTFTKRLSRDQLAYISIQIPHRSNWSESEFDKIRDAIKADFKIGSREYTEALNIIQGHYEFANNIGMTVKLKSASKDELKIFIDTWLVFHSEEPKKIDTAEASEIGFFNVFMDADQRERRRAALEVAVRKIGLNAQADIGALFFLARYSKYSETYNQIFEIELTDVTCRNVDVDSDENEPYLVHFLDKANFIENMVVSLKLLKQFELLKELKKEYNVVDAEINKTRSADSVSY